MYFPFVAKAGLWDLERTSSRRAVDGCEPAHVATAEEHGILSSIIPVMLPSAVGMGHVYLHADLCLCTNHRFHPSSVPSALLDAGVDWVWTDGCGL